MPVSLVSLDFLESPDSLDFPESPATLPVSPETHTPQLCWETTLLKATTTTFLSPELPSCKTVA